MNFHHIEIENFSLFNQSEVNPSNSNWFYKRHIQSLILNEIQNSPKPGGTDEATSTVAQEAFNSALECAVHVSIVVRRRDLLEPSSVSESVDVEDLEAHPSYQSLMRFGHFCPDLFRFQSSSWFHPYHSL